MEEEKKKNSVSEEPITEKKGFWKRALTVGKWVGGAAVAATGLIICYKAGEKHGRNLAEVPTTTTETEIK